MSERNLFDKGQTELDHHDLAFLIALLMESRHQKSGQLGEAERRVFDKLWRQMLELATRGNET